MGLKILQVTGSLRVGGLENVAMDCYRIAKSKGCETDFLVFGENVEQYEAEVLQDGGKVIHIDPPSNGYLKFYNNIKRVIKDNCGYDIVHSHTFFNSGIVLKAAKACGVKKCIAHCHSSRRSGSDRINRKLYNHMMRRLVLRNSDVCCACSLQAGNYFFGEAVFDRCGVILLNRIDTSRCRFNEDSRERIRTELGVPEDAVVIGTVGHLTAAKNQALLIDVFTACFAGNEKYRLLIVGDGELRELLKQKTIESGIESQVVFTGMRMDVGDLLSSMDVFVLTSKHEGLGIVLLESQANGLPTIGIEGVIAKEVIMSRYFYLIRNENDMDEWKETISTALNSGRDESVEAYNKIDNIRKTFQDTVCQIYGI